METLTTILIILAGVGAAFIFTDEYIFEWLQEIIDKSSLPRPIKVLMGCPVCLSFWTTLTIALIFGFQWFSIIMALVATLISKIIALYES